jgi:hypothetical protein
MPQIKKKSFNRLFCNGLVLAVPKGVPFTWMDTSGNPFPLSSVTLPDTVRLFARRCVHKVNTSSTIIRNFLILNCFEFIRATRIFIMLQRLL